jgi:hypothetical protein
MHPLRSATGCRRIPTEERRVNGYSIHEAYIGHGDGLEVHAAVVDNTDFVLRETIGV